MINLNLFISYSHLDEDSVDTFNKHMAPLTTRASGSVNIVSDRQVIAGQDYQDKIDESIEGADIICLFISANYLSSDACNKEMIRAHELRKEKGVVVISIILEACGWKDISGTSRLLVLPTDGNPINSYKNLSDGWNVVYEGLKKSVDLELTLKNAKITETFLSFLENTGMLTNAHKHKEKVCLNDVFVYPTLKKYDDLREYRNSESSEKVIHNIVNYSKILIAGEKQSGKTTLCKKIFLELRNKNYFPVYVADKNKSFLGKLDNKISNAFSQQYENIDLDQVEKDKIIPIIDDFHNAKHKEKNIKALAKYKYQIIVVDDIFSLNMKDESIIESFSHYKISELKPSLRSELIKKWTSLAVNEADKRYHSHDKTTELVNATLGKVIGSGIMPAYPFFILSVISTSEALGKPLDQEITSQGHCYQALIYLYLVKAGVENEVIDTYINYLTELSFFFYSNKKQELSPYEFDIFMKQYLGKFNLPIKEETLLNKLHKTSIIAEDSCGNYSFCYQYLYYFFVAKYISEHIENNSEIIKEIITNLQTDENAYIAIFISHHSKNEDILDKITLNASALFNKQTHATLKKDEIDFLDKHIDTIINAALPLGNSTPENERDKILITQDKEDQLERNNNENEINDGDDDDALTIELRRAIKTVEVMGRIIKNRAGSLKKERLELIFEEAMNVHLRILNSFIEMIEKDQEKYVDYISSRVKSIIETKTEKRKKNKQKISKPSSQDLKKLSKTIFWNMNFLIMYGLINKIVHSLGSDMLTNVIVRVCDKENTPATFLVKHGIFMWYNKNLQINNIVEVIDNDNFSETAKKILNHMIVNHCLVHDVNFRDKQKIGNKLNIPRQKLLPKATD